MPLRHPSRPGRPDCRAFTAVEMLIVIFIISLLLAFIVVAVQGIRHQAQDQATRSTIATLEAACDLYFKAWHHFPPDNFADLGLSEPPRHQQLRDAGDTELVVTVTGSECLGIGLTSSQLGGPFFKEMHAKKMCDLDRDGLPDARFTLWEFKDGWDNAVRYEMLGDTVGVRLWSGGRDMLFGTDDDIRNR